MKHFFFSMLAIFFAATMTSVLTCQALAAGTKAAKAAKDEFSKEALMIELTGKDDNALNDVDLYSEIVAAYQSQDEIGFKSRMQKFLSKFPKSPFADNTLYLAGVMALENKNYPEALKYLGRLSSEYPRSNRMVAGQFAKAMAYKRMHLDPEAKKVFGEIMQKYPGSPESFRADTEIRLMN